MLIILQVILLTIQFQNKWNSTTIISICKLWKIVIYILVKYSKWYTNYYLKTHPWITRENPTFKCTWIKWNIIFYSKNLITKIWKVKHVMKVGERKLSSIIDPNHLHQNLFPKVKWQRRYYNIYKSCKNRILEDWLGS